MDAAVFLLVTRLLPNRPRKSKRDGTRSHSYDRSFDSLLIADLIELK